MKLIKKLDNNLFTALVVLLISLVCFGATSFLLTGSYIDIPLGFLLSGGIITVLYIASYLLVRLDIKRGSSVFSIISIIMRLVVLLVSLTLVMLMYYRWNIKLFNVFVFVGVYTLGIIIFMLATMFRKNGKE